MKFIIGNKKFDTDKMTKVYEGNITYFVKQHSFVSRDFHNTSDYVYGVLYLTKKNNWVLETKRFRRLLTKEEVKTTFINNDLVDLYEKHFGKLQEG